MSLSENFQNRIDRFSQDKISDINCIIGMKKDVKEFIRKLKKFHMSSDCLHLQIRPEEIDELAGDKLI